jgi:hypothetical protein
LHIYENCVIVEGLIKKDRRVKFREIAEVTDITKGVVHKVIIDLNFCKMSARWLKCSEHRSKRMAVSFENLCRYQNEENRSWKLR